MVDFAISVFFILLFEVLEMSQLFFFVFFEIVFLSILVRILLTASDTHPV